MGTSGLQSKLLKDSNRLCAHFQKIMYKCILCILKNSVPSFEIRRLSFERPTIGIYLGDPELNLMQYKIMQYISQYVHAIAVMTGEKRIRDS